VFDENPLNNPRILASPFMVFIEGQVVFRKKK